MKKGTENTYPMLKVKLQLKAEEDIERSGWKKDDTLELINEIFNKDTGIAYFPLDKGWKIIKMEILEVDPNSNQEEEIR